MDAEEEEVIKLYEDRIPVKQIANKFRVCKGTIWNILKKHNKTRPLQKADSKQLEEILRSFDSSTSVRKLAKQYNYSVTGMSLLLQRNHKKVLRSQDKVQRDWSFIHTINELFLYWLGWMLTDGCIIYVRHDNRDRGIKTALTIHQKDSLILDFFKNIIQPNIKISKAGKNGLLLRIGIDRQRAQLLCSWGLVPRKSLVIKPTSNLNNLTNQEFCQLFCGIIEGDGNIYSCTMKKYRVLRIRVYSASSQFIGWIRQRLYLLGFKKRKISGYKAKSSCYGYAIAGKDAVRLSKLLLNCKYHLLNRKWNKCKEFLV